MKMFTEKSFEVFEVAGLEPRMTAIRSEIQPVFAELAEYFKVQLEPELNAEYFVHIAQHRRRSVYPPENTLVALSRNKRGYKMEPHFQLGISPEFVFIWLACIDQPKNEQMIAQNLLDQLEVFHNLSTDFSLSGDHTKNNVIPFDLPQVEKMLLRFRDVKKGEFQIGRIIPRDSSLWKTPVKAREYMLSTYQQLIPAYRQMLSTEK